MSDIQQDLKADLQQIANKTGSLILSFVAPESAIKRSPSSYDYASITTSDLYTIEKAIIAIHKEYGKLPPKLKLVIHTPGGSTFVTTKIAKYLRSKFEHITAYVPYEASSGGTVLCLGADKLVMDEISNLTPIDPQIPYRGTYVSVSSYQQAIDDLAKKFETTTPGDLYPPYSHLCESFDPVVMKEMEKKAFDAVYVAMSLLNKHINDNTRCLKIAFGLVQTSFSHMHVIDIDEAKTIGLELDTSQPEMDSLGIFKLWVGEKLTADSSNHIVEYFVPSKTQSDTKITTKETEAKK